MPIESPELNHLQRRFQALRGDPAIPADIGISIPVNAKADLENVLILLGDLARYTGSHTLEIVTVINNYPTEAPPDAIVLFEQLGLHVIAQPNIRKPGEPPGFTARLMGVQASMAAVFVSFDADCRIPSPGPLIDWYVAQFRAGADVAYTHVGYFDLNPGLVVKARVAAHHGARWFKRAVLGIPTTRGSNYGVRKSFILPLYDAGYLADEMNVGPVAKAKGARVAYSGRRELAVLTSGRYLGGDLLGLLRYLWYRLEYNLRVLPVRKDASTRTKRP